MALAKRGKAELYVARFQQALRRLVTIHRGRFAEPDAGGVWVPEASISGWAAGRRLRRAVVIERRAGVEPALACAAQRARTGILGAGRARALVGGVAAARGG